MCGIAGVYRPNGPDAGALVKNMCDRIRHRGPDDEGFYTDGGCTIGMRRLSIIDLSTGHQPIANEDRSVWIVFNGEVYNYQELRARLTSQGHRFQTNSDTETILHLYEQEGVEGISRLRGMFGYAIWDSKRRRILLVRDRFGKKPLYYAIRPEGIYFGSELKCLAETGVPLELDHDALRLFFQFNYIPDPWSAYRGIQKLTPGGWLTYDSNGTVSEGRYWHLPVPAERDAQPPISEDQICDRVRDIFDESIRMRMIADVPLGAFLSGGIDSSLVVASMARQSTEPVKTFSIGFEESKFNELKYAKLLAQRYKTDHHEILVRPDSIALTERIVDHYDEPFGDDSAIPTMIVSGFARRYVKVALTGDGGDELFGGYESFQWVENNRRYDRIPISLRGVLEGIANMLPYRAYGKNYLRLMSRPSPLERYFESNYAPYFLRTRLLQPDWMLPADAGFLTRIFADCLPRNGADILTQAMYFEATAKLTGDMLVKVDRASMAESLEVRCPLLDHVFAEYAATIPHHLKLRNGTGKYILLKALGDRLPPELINRKKMGFGVPLSIWFRGELREFLRDHLTGRFLERGVVSPEFVRYLLDEHESGRRDNSSWLWSLLMFELWYRKWEARPQLTPA